MPTPARGPVDHVHARLTSRAAARAAGLALCLTVALGGALAGCGDGDPDPSTTASPIGSAGALDTPSSAPGTDSASASTPAATSSATPGACTPPGEDVTWTQGEATVSLTGAATGERRLDLADDATYAASDGELVLAFADDAGTTVSLDLEGTSPCAPEAFTSVGLETGQTFVDPSHTQCQVAVTRLDEAAVSGTVVCAGLSGGGEGARLDVSGTFSVTS